MIPSFIQTKLTQHRSCFASFSRNKEANDGLNIASTCSPCCQVTSLGCDYCCFFSRSQSNMYWTNSWLEIFCCRTWSVRERNPTPVIVQPRLPLRRSQHRRQCRCRPRLRPVQSRPRVGRLHRGPEHAGHAARDAMQLKTSNK